MREVTFGDFAKLAHRRGLTPEYLAERFTEKIERPSEFFHRVFQGQHAAVVVSFRSVLVFYSSELECYQDSSGRHRACACGCGQPVFDRKKWASAGCKKRASRNNVTDGEKGLGQVVDFAEARPGQNRQVATLPSTDEFRPNYGF
jgi:hypothetical protein